MCIPHNSAEYFPHSVTPLRSVKQLIARRHFCITQTNKDFQCDLSTAQHDWPNALRIDQMLRENALTDQIRLGPAIYRI